MRKALVLAALAALLTAPVVASGDTSRGTADDYRINLTLQLSEDGTTPIAVKRFRFRRLDVICAGDEVTEVGGRIARMRVNDENRFRKTVRRPDHTVRVRGRVADNLKRIRGVLRARGDFGEFEDCDSGPVRWRARVG